MVLTIQNTLSQFGNNFNLVFIRIPLYIPYKLYNNSTFDAYTLTKIQ